MLTKVISKDVTPPQDSTGIQNAKSRKKHWYSRTVWHIPVAATSKLHLRDRNVSVITCWQLDGVFNNLVTVLTFSVSL